MVLVSVVHNRKKVVWLEKNGRFSEQAGLYFDRRPPYMCAALVVPALLSLQKESKQPESHPEARFRSGIFCLENWREEAMTLA